MPANESPPRDAQTPMLERVRIRNYKSIAGCDLSLSPITFLIGRNGAGKSNLIDALRFVVDALQTSLDHAIKSRGGIDDVRRRSTGHPRNFAIELELGLAPDKHALYRFEITARKGGAFAVKLEELEVSNPATREVHASYRVQNAEVVSSIDHMPPAQRDRLYLVTAAGRPEFRSTFDALVSMGFYNLNPDAMKEVQSPDAGEILHRDGSNIASVLARMRADSPAQADRVREFLTSIVPGIEDVTRVSLGPKETLQFKQEVLGSPHPWKFYANSMSDGTLRALGSLVAVSQLTNGSGPVRLVGLEEPETALHPAAAGALMDALAEAGSRTQILVTSHSPELVDQIDLESHKLLIVTSRQGTTYIANADPASLDAIRRHLYTAGELLRLDQLEPDAEDLQRQLGLFNGPEAT